MEADITNYVPLSIEGSPYKLGPSIKGSASLFIGFFNNEIKIALKRYQYSDIESKKYQRNLEFLSSPANRHPNLTRYYGQAVQMGEKGPKFSFLAIEFCEYSVADIIPENGRAPYNIPQNAVDEILNSISHREILRQSFEAVSYLHGLGMIHRKISPDKFLISCVDPNKNQFLIKITDYQLLKNVETNPGNTPIKPRDSWVAPESFKTPSEYTNESDAFVMGLYCYYVLCKGKHPFGDKSSTQKTNIPNNQFDVYKSDWTAGPDWKNAFSHEEEASWALDMIKDMVKFHPSERKSVEDVLLKRKYFQPESYQIYHSPKAGIKPGLCVIVTQAKYHNPANDGCWEYYSGEKKPSGLNIDAKNLETTFGSFGYDVLSFKNLQADEIERYMSPRELLRMIDTQENKTEGSPSFKNYASLVVSILGHGGQGVVYGVDDSPVSLNTIQYDAFDNNACPDLKGKPKVFIIFACQGERTQQDTSVQVAAFPMPTQTKTFVNDVGECSPPVFDFIRLISTIEGYKAFGDWRNGTPFINSLCRALDHEYKEVLENLKDPVNDKEEFEKEENRILKKILGKRDLTQLFTTFVTPLVGRTTIQTPEFRSSLSKTIRFRRLTTNTGTVFNVAYDGAESKAFKKKRAEYVSRGCKASKIISDTDITALLYTIDAEAPRNECSLRNEVQEAIAWVILNRYKSNFKDWGGNKSLGDVCKYPGIDGFSYWKNHPLNPEILDEATLNSSHNWLISVYDGDDSSKGATNYYLNDQLSGRTREDLEPTIKIGDYHFYRLSSIAKERMGTHESKRPRLDEQRN